VRGGPGRYGQGSAEERLRRVEQIRFDGMQFRTDIGYRAIKR
jgi:phosphoribosylamine-glycine ligase